MNRHYFLLLAVLGVACAAPVPTPEQLQWASFEIGAMISYEMYTFYPNTSAYWIPPVDAFDPVDMDMDSWIKAAVTFGAKYAILTTKHSAGFCLWPTTYPGYDYSVKNTKWGQGKRDLVGEFVQACEKYGVKPGFYYSIATNYYKNITGGYPMDGNKTKWEEYNAIVEYQLTELLAKYPQVVELWLDGGVIPHDQGGPNILPILEQYAPNAVVFNSPKGFKQCIRWIGNEQGIAYDPNWSLCAWPHCSGSGSPIGDTWCPSEIDTPLRDNGRSDWFWLPDGGRYVKTIDQIMSQYIQSVGRNGNYLLNIAPNNRGTIDSIDMQRYIEIGTAVEFYSKEYALASSEGIGSRVDLALGEYEQWIDTIIIMENQEKGEFIQEWQVYGEDINGVWNLLVNGSSIGHKRISALANAVNVKTLSLQITKHTHTPIIDFFGAYLIN